MRSWGAPLDERHVDLLERIKTTVAVAWMLTQIRKSRRGRALLRRLRGIVGPAVPSVHLPASTPPSRRARAQAIDVKQQEYELLRVEYRDQGPTPDLLARARSHARNTVAWGQLPAKTWLVYAAAFLEAGETDFAERVLRGYITRYGYRAIGDFLPVARLARELGLCTPGIDEGSAIAKVLIGNGEGNRFSELVKGKTIAVVGNGPGNLGSGFGEEIDAHDIVIRFNNFPGNYGADYGVRTDVWVRGAHRDVRDRPEIEDFSLVLWEMDFSRNFLEYPTHRALLYRDTLFNPERVAYIDTGTKRSLREASGLLLPTSGAQVIWLLRQARGTLDGVDVYGFSALDGSRDFGHYFDKLGDMRRRHDVDAEGRFLQQLFRDAQSNVAVHFPGTVLTHREDEIVVFNCAYRAYDPGAGRTGGAAGVLATQQRALGDEYVGQQLCYIFEGGNKEALKKQLAVHLAGLRGKIADIILGGEYVRTNRKILETQKTGKRMLFVCHELGSAFGAYLLGVPYVIVYHQRGSTLEEMRSIGQTPTDHEIAAATRLDEIICANASTMYFPSLGARDTFKETADPALVGRINFSEWALYNTVSAADHDATGADRSALMASAVRKLSLPDKDADTDVFISVGDWSEGKGLDRVPALLSRYAQLSERRVVWIAIGPTLVKSHFEEVQAQRAVWPFESRLIGERIDHDRLLALLDYADYFVMMHRNAIFDLATLEAMRAGKPLILSPVGGNREVNLADNVAFVTEESIDDVCRVIQARDRRKWGELNRDVFEQHFTLEHFAERYRAMLDEQLARVRQRVDA